MWQLTEKGRWFDTGAWFLEATKNLSHREIRVQDYIVHYGGASFKIGKKQTQEKWLAKYRKYYE